MPDVHSLKTVLEARLPLWLSVNRALQAISALFRIQPLLLRNVEQRMLPHQRPQTAWMSFAKSIVEDALQPETWPLSSSNWEHDTRQPSEQTIQTFVNDLPTICDFLEINSQDTQLKTLSNLESPQILMCKLTHCRYCETENGGHPLLYGHERKLVTIYGSDFTRSKAHLIVAKCPKCEAFYYPDAIHCVPPRDHAGGRAQNQRDRKLLPDIDWYPVSRHGIWAHRNIAHMLHCSTKHKALEVILGKIHFIL